MAFYLIVLLLAFIGPPDEYIFFIIVAKGGSLSDEELEQLAEKIGNKWKPFGRQLNFDEAQLTGFHENNEGYSNKAYAMLLAWRQRNGNAGATYEGLKKALCDADSTDFTDIFCQ